MSTAYVNPTPSHWAATASKLRKNRLHLHYGPIDLLIDVDGDSDTIAAAHESARRRFDGLLEELVSEIALLRSPMSAQLALHGTVAKAMGRACLPHASRFITPMAAVAGAVADYLLQAMVQAAPKATRLWVNNGGDIALWLSAGAQCSMAVYQNNATCAATVTLRSQDGVGGIATSGWPGRSHSLGVADAVTVLAPTAAGADMAATLIANAVRLPRVEWDAQYVQRLPANELQPDSDLAHTPVTVAVSELPQPLREAAVHNGLNEARALMNEASLAGVFIDCQGHRVSLGECA